jgi:hypothetical protein
MARKAKPVEKTDSCEGISDEDKMFEVSLIVVQPKSKFYLRNKKQMYSVISFILHEPWGEKLRLFLPRLNLVTTFRHCRNRNLAPIPMILT